MLEFTVDGKKYEIKRTLKRKSTGVNQDSKNSWIKADGQMEPLSPSELKQRVLQILKFNEPADPKAESKIFRYAIFTPQEAMKEVLSNPRKRLETIRKAFGIEDYSIAESNAREVLIELRTRARVLQERFSNITELEKQISESEKEIIGLQKDIDKSTQKRNELEEKEDSISIQIKELQEKNAQKIKLKSKKENLEDKIDSNKRRIKEIEREFSDCESDLKQDNERLEKLLEIKRPDTEKSVSELSSEIERLQKINDEMIGFKSEKNSINEDLEELKFTLGEKIKSDKVSLENTLNSLEKERDSLLEFAQEIKEKQEKVNEQKVQKQTLKSSIEKEITTFSQLGNACPTCKQEITKEHHHSLVDEKQKEVDALNEELKSITDSFFESNSKTKEIEKKIDSYEQEINQIQKILPSIQDYSRKSSKLVEIEAKIQQLNDSSNGYSSVSALGKLKDQLVKYEHAMEQIKQIIESKKKIENQIKKNQTEVEQLESEIVKNEAELGQIEARLEDFGDLRSIISEKEIQQDRIREAITEVSNALTSAKERINNHQEKITQNKEQISESKKWKEKHHRVSQFQEWLEEFFIPTTSRIEKQVLLSILQNFNETYTRWYSLLVEDPTKESRIDEDFTPIVNQDGYEQEIGFLSGGEKTSIALAYRLTLNSLIRKEMESMKSNLLILDEPTDGFSKNQLGKIRELLDELKSEQIVLVSHEKELETYVDNIFQISKQDGISKINRLS